MASRDEQADILGGPILQRPDSGIFAAFSRYHLVFKSVTLLGLGLLVWIACARGLEHLKKQRELRYRKAMRRKHGIPDSDCRPFAVAYAAAKRAHLEREAQDRKKSTVSDHDLPAVDQRTNAQKDACLLRRRVPETSIQLHDYHLSGKQAGVYDNRRPEIHALDFADRYNPNPRRRAVTPEQLLVESPPVRCASRKVHVINLDSEESKKRSFEDESDVEHENTKKSRIDGDELVDVEEPGDWYAQYSNRFPRRASKESLGRQPGAYINGQEELNRINDFRNEDHEPDGAMESIDEDEVTELKAVARGKKRDRAEAGSTFGGDEEDDIRNGRASHHRKRRTIFRKRIEIPARGQKRDREVESPESEDENVDSETFRRRTQHSSKKRRGKKATSEEVSEMSMEDPRVSKDPLCGGRIVGDDWEADGVHYKVGDKGERLRLTLVKKARNRYAMPQDSQHPDRSAALEIYVEMWMTEEQYKQAEGRHELAWQEASRESSGSKTPDVLDSLAKDGKNLLWDSVKCSPVRRPFRQFIASGAPTRNNPFEQWQSQPISGRRVASSSTIVSPILSGAADSPTRPGFRGFSKWEKQDREAEAMVRIRAKIEEQKKAQAPAQKSAETPTSIIDPELGTKPLSVPTITLTPAPAVAVEGKSDDSTSQSKSAVSTFSFATPPSTSNSIKGTAASTSTSDFSLPSASAATPSTLFPSVPTASTTSSTASLSPFSFAKPLQAPPSASTTTLSSMMPGIFGKGADASTSTASAPSPSTSGAMAVPQPLSTESASKPGSFTFANPETSSSSLSSLVVVAPSPVKSQTPTFNTTSKPSASMNFGSASVTTKAETPALLISAPATSESLKPAVPVFSFSGASSSTTAVPISTAPSVPKFSFGQPSKTSTFAPGSNPSPDSASQPKPTFKFSQTQLGATEGASVYESKKLTLPVSVFSTTAGLNEPAQPSSFGTTSAPGRSALSLPSASATNVLGKPIALGGDSSTPMPPKLTLAPASATTFDSTSSTYPGASASGIAPVFSFGGTGTNSGPKSAEGSKPASLFGGATGGLSTVVMSGNNPTEGKPTFRFSTPTDGPKATSVFGGNIESSKSPSIFGNPAEGSKPTPVFGSSQETFKPASVFGGAVEGSKSTFTSSDTAENKATFGPATESPKPVSIAPDSPKSSNTVDPSKPTPILRSTIAGSHTSASLFTFGKDHVATNTSTQTQPAGSFTFGTPLSATGSMFGQSSAFTTSGDPSPSMFGKPNTTPSAFGFAGTGGSSSSSTFTFGKTAAQNQKQEQ